MSKTPLACTPHDHDHCVSHALAEADSLCARQGVRLTALRKRVLELVWQSHKPLGAYDILAVLSEQDGRRAAIAAASCGGAAQARPRNPTADITHLGQHIMHNKLHG